MRIFVGVYWSARREGVHDCADRLHRYFLALSSSSERLGRWCKLASKKPKSPTYVDVTSTEGLELLLQGGVNRRDVDREVMPELGYRVMLWNGDEGGWSAQAAVKCGLYSVNTGLSNSANISVSIEDGQSVNVNMFEKILTSLTEIWDADRGVLTLTAPDSAGEYIDLDYLTYFKDGAKRPAIPGSLEKAGRGWVVRNPDAVQGLLP